MVEHNWKCGLPRECRPATVPPVVQEKFEEESLGAVRIKGFDPLRELCYYYHSYTLCQESLDEEGLYGEFETFRQEITAWRLYTGGWLIRQHEAGPQGDCASRLAKPRFWISAADPLGLGTFDFSMQGLRIEPESLTPEE